MFKLVLEKAEEPGSNCQHLLDHRKSKSSRETSISALLTMPKPLTVWITLENPMDRGAWQAVVHRVTKSQTQQKLLCTRKPATSLKTLETYFKEMQL